MHAALYAARMRPTLLVVCLLVALAPGLAQGARFPAPPPAGTFVVDAAGVLPEAERAELSRTAAALLAQEQVPLFVVTVPSLSAYDATTDTIESYATALFNDWGIGSADRNAGMLLVVSTQDRKARIELGAHWGRTHDAQALEVMQKLIVPAFKRGDYPTGIRDGVRGMNAMARGLALPRASAPVWFWPAIALVAVGLVVLVVNLFRSGRSGWAWAVIAAVAAFVLFILFRKGNASGRGGGSSGGGGATGSW